MLTHLLATVIEQTFEKEVGRWQTRRTLRKAIKFSFSLTINHDKEEGYRSVDLVLYAPYNYVGVYVRERWNVIDLDHLVDGDDGVVYIKDGHDYEEGASDWTCIAYHDSCWRSDGVQDFLSKYQDRLQTFENSALSSFFDTMKVPEELEHAHEKKNPSRVYF